MSTPEPHEAQNRYDGWAIVEQMGHNRYAGYVSTEIFGQAVLFRIDVPALEERERVTKRPGYGLNDEYLPAGTLVRELAVQGYTKYIGPATLYALTPCTKEAALAAVEEIQPRRLMAVKLPEAEPARLSEAVHTAPRYVPMDEDPYTDGPDQ